MDSPTEEWTPTFWIGHHDSNRIRVTFDIAQQANNYNYDMLTSPITTPYFHTRVLTLLHNHISPRHALSSGPTSPHSLAPSIASKTTPMKSAHHELVSDADEGLPVPTISSLTSVDTPLAPGEMINRLIGVVSPWIDLCSPDPIVYQISRQVLELEVAFAAFCGIGNIILPSPRLHHGKLHGEGITQYAYAIQNALEIAKFMQFSILLPMMDEPVQDRGEDETNLSGRARGKYMGLSEDHGHQRTSIEESMEDENGANLSRPRKKPVKVDFFGTWDAWNIIRTLCKYHTRLLVALSIPSHLPPLSVRSRWHSEPLRLLCFSEKTFYENTRGYPSFTHSHQELLTQYMRIRHPPWILLMDIGPIPEPQYLDATMTSAAGWPPSDISADSSLPTPAEASLLDRNDSKKSRTDKRGPTPHLDYLRNLQRKQPPKTTMQRFGSGYQDYLQSPLQPLTDNLDSVTYEVFENDPVKYDLYYQAIVSALNDWRSQNKPASGTDGRIVVAVVGAGRGPLVTRALRASESEGVPIELWALEKNQNAFVLLQQHNEETWGGRVNLVKSDMRSWKGPLRQAAPATVQSAGYTGQWPPPRDDDDGDTSITLSLRNTHHNTHPTASPTTHIPIDILISELLGSLGDNELSPECLDGITPLLNRTHGISIPRSYTAFLTPISAPKIHADLLARSHTEKSAPNTPWVVMLHAVDFLSATASSRGGGDEGGGSVVKSVPNILPIWTFTHTPGAAIEGNRHNERQARVSFNLRDRAVCHGLAGYFEAELYPGVELSTNPLNMDIKSEGMMSWFPIYFPLKTPLYTPDASTLTVSIFRATDNRKVWYEWMVESYSNLMGLGSSVGEKRKVRLGVSEVGSSREGGCMM